MSTLDLRQIRVLHRYHLPLLVFGAHCVTLARIGIDGFRPRQATGVFSTMLRRAVGGQLACSLLPARLQCGALPMPRFPTLALPRLISCTPLVSRSSAATLQLHSVRWYARESGRGGRTSSARGGSYSRKRSSPSSSSSSFTSPSVLLALLRALPSAVRSRLLLGGGLLAAVCGGLVVVFVAALPYIVLPLLGLWLGRRIYRFITQSSAAAPPQSDTHGSTRHSSPFSASASASPFSSSSSSFAPPSAWSSLLSSPLSLLSSLAGADVLSGLSADADAAVAVALSHPTVHSALGGADAEEEEEEAAVGVEIESQQARLVSGNMSGTVVASVSSVSTGRAVQLSIDFERALGDSSGSSAVRLTRLLMRRDGSPAAEELPVEQSDHTRPSSDNVIDVPFEVTREQPSSSQRQPSSAQR